MRGNGAGRTLLLLMHGANAFVKDRDGFPLPQAVLSVYNPYNPGDLNDESLGARTAGVFLGYVAKKYGAARAAELVNSGRMFTSAIADANPPMVELLLRHGANVNVTTRMKIDGEDATFTALSYARMMRERFPDAEDAIMKILVRRGAREGVKASREEHGRGVAREVARASRGRASGLGGAPRGLRGDQSRSRARRLRRGGAQSRRRSSDARPNCRTLGRLSAPHREPCR